MIEDVRARTSRAFHVNVFVHPKPTPDATREAAWLQAIKPLFEEFQTPPPAALAAIHESVPDDHAMTEMLVAAAVPVISFHFGPASIGTYRLTSCGAP